MIGELATSKAGHDKDRLYMIVGEEGECVYLCDGRLRGVEHPKKKKKNHIQSIHSSAQDPLIQIIKQNLPASTRPLPDHSGTSTWHVHKHFYPAVSLWHSVP